MPHRAAPDTARNWGRPRWGGENLSERPTLGRMGWPRPCPAPPAPVESPEGAVQAGQGFSLTGLHAAVQEVTDLVPLLGCQVPGAVQVEGQLPELHQHPRALRHTCQIGCQKLAERRQTGGKQGWGRAHLSRALDPTAAGGEPATRGPAPSPWSLPARPCPAPQNCFPHLSSWGTAGPNTQPVGDTCTRGRDV